MDRKIVVHAVPAKQKVIIVQKWGSPPEQEVNDRLWALGQKWKPVSASTAVTVRHNESAEINGKRCRVDQILYVTTVLVTLEQ